MHVLVSLAALWFVVAGAFLIAHGLQDQHSDLIWWGVFCFFVCIPGCFLLPSLLARLDREQLMLLLAAVLYVYWVWERTSFYGW